jgi:hypothetical protein
MRRRILWLCRFAYWLAVHRSVSNALWVLDLEGHLWRADRTAVASEMEGSKPSAIEAAKAEGN